MGRAVVRVDRSSGKNYCDWYLDQGARWAERAVWHVGDPVSDPVDVSDCTARLVARRADGDRELLLELDGDDIVNGGVDGFFEWDVDAETMQTFVHVTYVWALIVLPDGDEDLAAPLLEGRIVMRPMVDDPEVVSS